MHAGSLIPSYILQSYAEIYPMCSSLKFSTTLNSWTSKLNSTWLYWVTHGADISKDENELTWNSIEFRDINPKETKVSVKSEYFVDRETRPWTHIQLDKL